MHLPFPQFLLSFSLVTGGLQKSRPSGKNGGGTEERKEGRREERRKEGEGKIGRGGGKEKLV